MSNTISVALADGTPGGVLTAGDFLKLAPGQETAWNGATENTLVKLRVLSCKGEEREVLGGALVMLPLKALQDFDSAYRSRLDFGLREAEKNQQQFKSGTLK